MNGVRSLCRRAPFGTPAQLNIGEPDVDEGEVTLAFTDPEKK